MEHAAVVVKAADLRTRIVTAGNELCKYTVDTSQHSSNRLTGEKLNLIILISVSERVNNLNVNRNKTKEMIFVDCCQFSSNFF